MNITRRIQLTALAVTANGAAALALMSPTPALAADCAEASGYYCEEASGSCPTGEGFSLCNSLAPPGCNTAYSRCSTNFGCATTYEVECIFNAA